MDSIGVKPGMIIGEAGSGDGYFTFKLAKRIGGNGHLFANDIVKSKLRHINKKCKEDNISNITTILGEVEDPLFPKDSLDMVIMVYVFHHLDNPVKFLENTKTSMKPGATLVIVERDPERFGKEYNHFLKKKEVVKKIAEANYKLINLFTFLERDNIYVIQPKETGGN